jgi:hypothetical protein
MLTTYSLYIAENARSIGNSDFGLYLADLPNYISCHTGHLRDARQGLCKVVAGHAIMEETCPGSAIFGHRFGATRSARRQTAVDSSQY